MPALIGVLGGLVGAKLFWAVEFRDQAPFSALLLSRGGLSWFGGFVGGVSAGLWALHRRDIPLMAALAAAAPALAISHAIGRIGCFMVGDVYGRPTDLPCGVAFPEGRIGTNRRCRADRAIGRYRDCPSCAGRCLPPRAQQLHRRFPIGAVGQPV